MWRSASGADGLLVATRFCDGHHAAIRTTLSRLRASATTLVAGVIVAAVAVHPEHHDKDGDAPQSTQDGEGLEHSRSPRSDYFEQKLTLRTIATLQHICQLCGSPGLGACGTEAHRGSAAQRGQGDSLRASVPRCRQHREMRTLCRGATTRFTCVRRWFVPPLVIPRCSRAGIDSRDARTAARACSGPARRPRESR